MICVAAAVVVDGDGKVSQGRTSHYRFSGGRHLVQGGVPKSSVAVASRMIPRFGRDITPQNKKTMHIGFLSLMSVSCKLTIPNSDGNPVGTCTSPGLLLLAANRRTIRRRNIHGKRRVSLRYFHRSLTWPHRHVRVCGTLAPLAAALPLTNSATYSPTQKSHGPSSITALWLCDFGC